MKRIPAGASNRHARKRVNVWGGTVMHGGEVRMIVRAGSQKEAIGLLAAAGHPMSLHYFAEYWGGTGNLRELEVAFENGVWYTSDGYKEDATWTRML